MASKTFRFPPKPGDIIEISEGRNKYWAVFVGDKHVIHLSGPGTFFFELKSLLGLCPQGVVKKELLSTVAPKNTYWVNNKHDHELKPLKQKEIVERAEKLVGKEMPYNLTSEQFVIGLRYGFLTTSQNRIGPEPKPGDLIEFFRPALEHWAVYVGNDYVVHLTGFKRNGSGSIPSLSLLSNKGVVKKEKLQDVAKGDMYQVNNHDKYTPRSQSKIVEEAEKLVGQEVPYGLFTNNCEHFANKLRYGIAYSAQIGKELDGSYSGPRWICEIFSSIQNENFESRIFMFMWEILKNTDY